MDGTSEQDQRYLIRGGRRLEGEVTLAGAKNSVLKLMAASLLADEPSTIRRVPRIADVFTMADMLRALGADVRFVDGELRIDPSGGLIGVRPLRTRAHDARQHHRHGSARGATRDGR